MAAFTGDTCELASQDGLHRGVRAPAQDAVTRVLFVDDEPALLDGLRGRLRGMRRRWDMVFLESGQRALTEMELTPVDVIVADMRMPRMDGAELLAIVRDRWPSTIRIVLSGYSEEEQSTRLLTLAHQYLSKPCDAQQIESVITRSLELREVLQPLEMRALIGSLAELPILPEVREKLRAAMEQGRASAQELAAIICEDPPIAAKLLHVANSAFFRLSRRITDVEKAVAYLGVQALDKLLNSSAVFKPSPYSEQAPDGLSPRALQARAQRVCAAARALSAGSVFSEEAGLAGLLHNIGHWVLLQECPQQMRHAVDIAQSRGVPLHRAEQEIFGASHAEVGAYLLGLWGLPASVVEAVAFQYRPHCAPRSTYDVLGALVTAQSLTVATEPFAPGLFERVDGVVGDEYLRSLHAPFDWAEAERRVHQAAAKVTP